MKALIILAIALVQTAAAQAQSSDRYQLPVTTDAQSIQSFLFESLLERVDQDRIQQRGNSVRVSDGSSSVACTSRNAGGGRRQGQVGNQVMATSCLITGVSQLERTTRDSASTQAVLTKILRARHQLQLRAVVEPGTLMVHARNQNGGVVYSLTQGPVSLQCAELNPNDGMTTTVQRFACRLILAAHR